MKTNKKIEASFLGFSFVYNIDLRFQFTEIFCSCFGVNKNNLCHDVDKGPLAQLVRALA
jgi:hypothetical protein